MKPLGLPVCALLLLGPAPLRADPPLPRHLRLEYVRGPGAQECPAEDTMRFAIAGGSAR